MTIRICVMLAVVSLFFCSFTQAKNGDLVRTQEFATLKRFSSPELSPNGRYLAAKMFDGKRSYVVIRDLQNPDKGLHTLGEGLYYVDWFTWVNNERILFSARRTYKRHVWTRQSAAIGSVLYDGSGAIFYKAKVNNTGFYRANPKLISRIADDPKHVLLSLDNTPSQWAAPLVHKVNLETGERTKVQENLLSVSEWIADDYGSIGVGVKIDRARGERSVDLFLRNSSGELEVVSKSDYFDSNRLRPVRFKRGERDILLVLNNQKASRSIGIEKDSLLEFSLSQRKLLGVYRPPFEDQVRSDVDFLLEGYEWSVVSHSDTGGKLVIRAIRSDRPTRYYLYHSKNGQLEYLASQYPELDKVAHSKKQLKSFSARDGSLIPAYLSLPLQAESPSPLVVLVSHGPGGRDFDEFDRMVQWLNYKGIAVLQPQYRGSAGFGNKHLRAGDQQWGKLMQSDLMDGARWAVEEGFADEQRICVMGDNYGGYAAAMALVQNSESIRCGVSLNGIFDLPRYRKFVGRSRVYEEVNRATVNEGKDAKDYSPIHRSEDINSPLLLIYAGNDFRYRLEHSELMRDKLKSQGKMHEFYSFAKGEGYWNNQEKLLKVYQTMETFLDRYLLN